MAVASLVLSAAAAVHAEMHAAVVQLERPVRVSGPTGTGVLWFPDPLTLVPSNGVLVLRAAVHTDANMPTNAAALFTSTSGGVTWVSRTQGCTTANTAACSIPAKVCTAGARARVNPPDCSTAAQYGPTQSWELTIPQPDGTLLASQYQPFFVQSDATHRSLLWPAVPLSVAANGSVVVAGRERNITLTGLPRAINITETDGTGQVAANLYTGSGVEVDGGGGALLALLTNVRWALCAAWPYVMNASAPCYAVVLMESVDRGQSWQYRSTVTEAGSEATLEQLDDGRLMVVSRFDFGGLPRACQDQSD